MLMITHTVLNMEVLKRRAQVRSDPPRLMRGQMDRCRKKENYAPTMTVMTRKDIEKVTDIVWSSPMEPQRY